MVRPAGLEPATTRLEGGCSIQLSYGRRTGMNPWGYIKMVGVEGFEPPTFCSQSRRATGLRYTPNVEMPCISSGAHHSHGAGTRQRKSFKNLNLFANLALYL